MSRNNSYCTSLDQINCASIRGLITYKLNSKCPIIITGILEKFIFDICEFNANLEFVSISFDLES